jgi:hypothetical protein
MSDRMHCLARRTLYEWRRALSPGTPAGLRYDLRALIGEADLPDHVELVWHGVNDRTNLRHFLASPVRWGECDVRRATDGRLALRHDAFEGPVGPATRHPQPPTSPENVRGAVACSTRSAEGGGARPGRGRARRLGRGSGGWGLRAPGL